MCKYVCTCACYHICMCTYVRTCRITYIYIFETIFATILLQTYLDRIKWSDTTRVWFHSIVAKLWILGKRARPDCLAALAYLATRVDRCTTDDVDKLERLLRYIADTRDRGVVFRPGKFGIRVRVFIDAAYGVHPDGKSHTGSCVVIGDLGAVHCKSSKQSIVTKSSTEAELIALSDSANQGLYIRNFLISQGHKMKPVIIYQDNTSCMALVERGRSGAEHTRHIAIRNFWIREWVTTGEAVIEHMGGQGRCTRTY